MVRTLFIRPWNGPLPDYIEQYKDNIGLLKEYGFDWLIFNDMDKFIELVNKKLKIDVSDAIRNGDLYNVSEFRPAYGLIFEDYLEGYDFWGHTDFDCVYGRLDRFITEEFMDGVDMYGDDPNDMCGPFSLYRNTKEVNRLFQKYDGWEAIFRDRRYHAFDEIGMSQVVRVHPKHKFGHMQGNDKERHDIKLEDDGTLLMDGSEVMFYHFKNSKNWPI